MIRNTFDINFSLKIISLRLLLISFLCLNIQTASSQSPDQFYNYQFYQKLNSTLYSPDTRIHTSIKPFPFLDSLTAKQFDSLMTPLSDVNNRQNLITEIFNEHLFNLTNNSSAFYVDVLPNFGYGYATNSNNITLGSLGFQIGGNIDKKWKFNLSAFANKEKLPEYLNSYVRQVGVIPGQAFNTTPNNNYAEWDYLTFDLSYTPNQYLNIAVGRDKTFVGDGYRSLLLSDYASPYPFVKLNGLLGNVSYMAMYTYMNDPALTSQSGISQKKFGVFHYLDWNVNNRLSLGFFDNVIGYFQYGNGVKKPFDFYYINPIIFTKPINDSSDDPDKSLLGLTSKYKLNNHITLYGQFVLNEFESKNFFSNNGSSRNKYGWQLGLRGTNLFNIKGLNSLFEANAVKPYTYQARISVESYSENSEPLAHPWGANFREYLGLINYSYKNFEFMLEGDFGLYGLDFDNLNYGKDIFKLWTQPAGAAIGSTETYNNFIGQGLKTHMKYLEGRVSYILNPKYNLRLEADVVFRDEQNVQGFNNTKLFTIGIYSSFRQVYNDLTSYRRIGN